MQYGRSDPQRCSCPTPDFYNGKPVDVRLKSLLNMRNSKDGQDQPSVSLLLAALSWLTARRRRPPDRATQSAIAHHLHLLVLHPASDSFDIQAALYMAGRAGIDADGLVARFSGIPASLH